MSLFDAVRELPLVVESYDLDGYAYTISSEFTRKTTVIRLSGAGEEGLGEDVTYDGAEQDKQQARGPNLPLAGDWTLETFSPRPSSPAPERRITVVLRVNSELMVYA